MSTPAAYAFVLILFSVRGRRRVGRAAAKSAGSSSSEFPAFTGRAALPSSRLSDSRVFSAPFPDIIKQFLHRTFRNPPLFCPLYHIYRNPFSVFFTGISSSSTESILIGFFWCRRMIISCITPIGPCTSIRTSPFGRFST